ncbi:conserved protein of unknown function (plasmid) [Rhodovastum atsumiense]|uniref:Uncharacterized protein n=1 Tax=Rhodovastum atsumiense TaxID=504468 RepID=A0A5M6IVW0_9PROT|nr:hypothetical protein [Rhodovastum atsumiense]KAA5611638.1 hypothetical protein F1189_13845 [Rhodovastum atsumiense]CAH2606268.1 conserved protein of unknown function [Rhodovastum atsumiense]
MSIPAGFGEVAVSDLQIAVGKLPNGRVPVDFRAVLGVEEICERLPERLGTKGWIVACEGLFFWLRRVRLVEGGGRIFVASTT